MFWGFFLIVTSVMWGWLIPCMARRFAKFMPATPAYAFYMLIKPRKYAKKTSVEYRRLVKEYRLRSLMYALVLGGLGGVFSLFLIKFGLNLAICLGGMLFAWIAALLAEIDYRIFLLPDILTVPLLIFGFVFSACVESVGTNIYGDFPAVGTVQSSIGSLLGYFIPVLASMFMLKKSKDAFGGGDIKLLAAIGAWMGIRGLFFTILSSCVLFGVYMLVRGQKSGAFGPALTMAAVVYMVYSVANFVAF